MDIVQSLQIIYLLVLNALLNATMLKAGVKFCVISNLAAGNYNLLQV